MNTFVMAPSKLSGPTTEPNEPALKNFSQIATSNSSNSSHFREAPFRNVLVLYRHCPNSFRFPPPSVKRAAAEKSAPDLPGKPLHPRANVGKKVLQTILTILDTPPPSGNVHKWKQHISKRGSYSKICTPS